MKTIKINTAYPYDMVIGNGILPSIGTELKSLISPSKICVVTDETVSELYLSTVMSSLLGQGFDCVSYLVQGGENGKSMSTITSLLEYLAACDFDRNDCLLALGGGVVGDVTGFAAAIYLRGILFVQVPTTVLAAVDSSVGGKTGVNLKSGKNLAGCFWQPETIILDTDTFKTLPESVYAHGIAEAIKCAVLCDKQLFQNLSDKTFDIVDVIETCVSFKAGLVENDERDNGKRVVLNLGHTIAHAVERCSEYEISHGDAVAMGLYSIARAAEKQGMAKEGLSQRIRLALENNGLPYKAPLDPELVTSRIIFDKKRQGDDITLVIPRDIGSCGMVDFSINEAKAFLMQGLLG